MFNLTDTRRCVWVNGPVIIGAGPSTAGLKQQGVPYVILEREDCIASLWQKRTYDRLKLHLPKRFCQLPEFPFPDHYPEYPSKKQFVQYLEDYTRHHDISPHFNESVESAKYDEACHVWRVKTSSTNGGDTDTPQLVEYICQWLVVATGENAEPVVPGVDGLGNFAGEVIHACDYKSGGKFRGKKVLVVGCGNSGMEVSPDLCNHRAKPAMVVRGSVHVLPRDILGKSTFEMGMFMLQWLVDMIILLLAWMVFGSIKKVGFKRPKLGPLEMKSRGRAPVLDVGAVEKIKNNEIQVVAGVKSFRRGSVELEDGKRLDIDAVVLATGYRSNVPQWLQEWEFFGKNGFPKTLQAWKGNAGLYAVGFSRRGISGLSADAVNASRDIAQVWRDDLMQKKQKVPIHRRCISTL